ncbi:rod shape-determining protein RodA [Halopseudomonas salegens]|uniref:Peptidoglycan glycosyltransferase MrdB n=1 Tax=Halopseudomonas salegens TaxID=1434072 RepID=A0A1H2GG97_9GAMM|nr:rod shape-determining protein RodA [Halopseudomonas salegens]SDU18673.1 cell elongation-specific peptidoglycan biosynthesis regulator RodA [Halopseudomonas salegens]
MKLLKRLNTPAPQGYGRRMPLWQRIHVDPWLLLLLLVLATVAGFVLYSASGRSLALVYRQGAAYAVGLAVMLVIAQFQPRFMQRWVPLAYLAGVLLLVAVLVAGVQAKGAQRWLSIPGLMRFQPSEVMKLAMPMMLAWYLGRHTLRPTLPQVVISLLIVAVPVFLVLRQPDLGTSLLIATSGFFVLLLAGLRWRYMIGAAILLMPAAVAMWFFVLHNYQKQRVLTFLNPESDPLGAGWNIIQSKAAIGSGGVYGKGWLQGTQSHLDFLPEGHTDFVIAVLGEEFGMVGICLLLTVYLLIIARGLYITLQAQDSFCKLLAGSITLTFFVYVFVNIGMVSGLLPVVGVPLPLISYGGTSLVTLLAGFGILMSIHTHRKWMSEG